MYLTAMCTHCDKDKDKMGRLTVWQKNYMRL